MKIYTKTGDTGMTGLVGGTRVPKIDARIEAIGEVDEVNAALGLAVSLLPEDQAILAELRKIQAHLFDIGAELASIDGRHSRITLADAAQLEDSMDALTDALPPLTQFILPGGTQGAAALHLARSVARRAERAVLRLDSEAAVREEVKIYLNRLSDWLFIAARTANAHQNVSDEVWSQ